MICDEAHRTTGITLAESDESSFVKTHSHAQRLSYEDLHCHDLPAISCGAGGVRTLDLTDYEGSGFDRLSRPPASMLTRDAPEVSSASGGVTILRHATCHSGGQQP